MRTTRNRRRVRPDATLDDHDPETLLCTRTAYAELAQALRTLNPYEEEVVRRHSGLDGPEETFAEIGAALGRSRGAIGSTYTRALWHLRQALRDPVPATESPRVDLDARTELLQLAHGCPMDSIERHAHERLRAWGLIEGQERAWKLTEKGRFYAQALNPRPFETYRCACSYGWSLRCPFCNTWIHTHNRRWEEFPERCGGCGLSARPENYQGVNYPPRSNL